MARPELQVQFRPGAGPLFDPGSSGLDLAGLGGFAYTADHSSLDITGDIDLRADATLDDWSSGTYRALLAKWQFTGSESLSWVFSVTPTGGLRFSYAPDGTSATFAFVESDAAVGANDGTRRAVRVTCDVNNGAGGHTVTFYTADDLSSAWAQLGSPVVVAGTTSLHASTAQLEVGAYNAGGMDDPEWAPLAGVVHAAEVRNGIGGTAVANPVFSGRAAGTTGFTDAAGRSWALDGPAVITEGVDIDWVTLTEGGPHGNRVIGELEWSTGRERDDEDTPPGVATIRLKNDDRLFDPENSDGDYFGGLSPLVPFRIRATYDSGATWDDQFYGYVESGWVQTFEPPRGATCTVGLTDLLGVLAGRKKLPSVFESAVLAQQPSAFWVLGGSTDEVPDLAGNNDGVVQGSPSATDRRLVPGQPGALDFNANGDTDRVDVSRSPIIADPFAMTVMAVFRTSTDAEASSIHPVFFQGDGNVGSSGGVHVFLFIDEDGKVRLTAADGGGGFTWVSDVEVADGEPHIVFGVERAVGSGIAVDAAAVTATPAAGATQEGNGVAIGGTPFAPAGYDDNYFVGEVAAVAVFDRETSVLERQAIYDGYRSLDGLRSDQQVRWALSQLGVPSGLIDLDEGRAVMGPAETLDVDALEFVRRVVRTEQGSFFVDHRGGGKLRMTERYHGWLDARATTSQATFSDDPAESFDDVARVEPGDLNVEPNGLDSITNSWTVTWRDGEETAEDADSVARYGARGERVETLATTPHQARGLAQYLAALTSEPRARIVVVGINPGAAESCFPAATGLRLLDRVTYRSQPSATGSVIERDLTIEGCTHRVDGRSWEAQFFTSAAIDTQAQLFILGTSELDGPDILAI